MHPLASRACADPASVLPPLRNEQRECSRLGAKHQSLPADALEVSSAGWVGDIGHRTQGLVGCRRSKQLFVVEQRESSCVCCNLTSGPRIVTGALYRTRSTSPTVGESMQPGQRRSSHC